MIISLRCKECRNTLSGAKDEYLFLCSYCKTLYILKEKNFYKIESFIPKNDSEYNILLPFLIMHSGIEYLHFATDRQKEVSIKCGNSPVIAVRAFSMIDPLYFGDLETELTLKLSRSEFPLVLYTPQEKNFTMNIKPEVLERLARYTFMKYFDMQGDITGMEYSFRTESSAILFLRGKTSGNRLILQDVKQELPLSALLST